MSVFDDPRGKLQWLEDELLEEEIEEEEDIPSRWGRKAHRTAPESMAEREAVYVERKKREKGIGGLKFLAFLEILAILAIIWGWIQWLY